MAKLIPILEVITERVRLFDVGGNLVKWLEPDEAHGMIRRGEVMLLRTKRKIRGLKLIADYSNCGGPVRHKGSLGDPHQHETYDNPRGVYTFERIPRSSRKIFEAVVRDCLKAA